MNLDIKPLLGKLINAEIIWVWPEDLTNAHSVKKSEGIDLSGNWDKLGRSVLDGFIYKSFKRHLNGVEWKDTTIYKQRPKNRHWWARKLPIWDSMIADIIPNGFTQRPLLDPIDEYMSILIGRNGDMFIYNGIHRYVCCLLSEVKKKIPVKVLARHTEWAKFKQICHNYQQRRGRLYCQIPHPDLEDIPYYWTNERAEMIADHSLYQGGRVLDAGAHWGTTSYVLAQHNFDCLAVENTQQHYRKLQRISKLPGKSFRISNTDVLDMAKPFDTLILLNIAHHFIIDKEKYHKFLKFLENMTCGEIFYQAHKEGDKWASYISPSEYLNTIIKTAGMNSALSLKTFNGRELWHLSR